MTQLNLLPQLQQFCLILAADLRKQDFLTYFNKVSLMSHDDSSVTFGVVSEFIRDNVSHRFSAMILTAAQQVWENIETITIEVDPQIDSPSYTQVIDCRKTFKDLQKKEKNEVATIDLNGKEEFAGRYDLKNFVVGASNQLAYSACDAVVRKPGSHYNPLFIYSEVGLGKTHLLQGTALEIKKKFPEKKVVYITSDQFVSEYVNAVRDRKVDQMRARFRAIDVLLVDDIQFLAGKKGTQEEIYTLFNILYDAGKQIILSSDRPPKELTEIEPRLVSRFEWGIMVDIDMPDFETRLAVLQQKAREREFIIPQNVAEYIAYNMGRNIRELEGILNQIIAEFELHGKMPTIDSIVNRFDRLSIKHSVVGGGSTPSMNAILRSVSYDDVIKQVCEYFGVEPEQVLGGSRSRDLMIPRQIAMYLLKNKLKYTFERIGNIFNGREHSAVMYSCRKLDILLKKDQRLMADINNLRQKIGV